MARTVFSPKDRRRTCPDVLATVGSEYGQALQRRSNLRGLVPD